MQNIIVKMQGITKEFPGVKALDSVDFALRSGEVLALLGENGAGKSTLMKILSGVYQRDTGDIEVFGKKVGHWDNIKAQEAGIAIIHQELNMCGHLTIMQNIFLGREKCFSGILDNQAMRKETLEILNQLNMDLDPDMQVGDLPVSKQQMVEIAKALSVNAKVLIMDEPTSSLTSKEIDDLFRIISILKSQGCGIVYISHRLEELQHIVDRVTIMRDGTHITDMKFSQDRMDEIITNMVGREIKEKFPRVCCQRGKKVLEVNNLNAGKLIKDVSFELYEGEIVGMAGLMGAGRTETTRALFGIDKKDSGTVFLDGKEVKINKPIDAIRAGIVLAPEDRKKDGLCTRLSVKDNISLPNLDMLCSRLGVVSRKKEMIMADTAVRNLKIKLADIYTNAGGLSGGNQQKVVVSKWLERNSRVIIFDEPTRGIDVAAKVEIYHLMNQLKEAGIAILFVSSEMPEVLGISDRILVMCDGRITGELETKQATQDQILTCATRYEKKIAQ